MYASTNSPACWAIQLGLSINCFFRRFRYQMQACYFNSEYATLRYLGRYVSLLSLKAILRSSLIGEDANYCHLQTSFFVQILPLIATAIYYCCCIQRHLNREIQETLLRWKIYRQRQRRQRKFKQ